MLELVTQKCKVVRENKFFSEKNIKRFLLAFYSLAKETINLKKKGTLYIFYFSQYIIQFSFCNLCVIFFPFKMENNIGSMFTQGHMGSRMGLTGKAKGKEGQSIKLWQLKEKNYYFK